MEESKPLSCCCSCAPVPCGPGDTTSRPERTEPYLNGWIDSAAGPVPRLSTILSREDHRGSRRVRWGIGRDSYRIAPGLYGIGSPDSHSPVLVTANYKLTVDTLRSKLRGIHAWILVLDTKGINVWCAAGKGTFGTEELLYRMSDVKISSVVSHRKLILPQLGAPGIRSYEITRQTGFKVIYGPLRAEDIPYFLHHDFTATEEMRQVHFDWKERITVVPVEIVQGLKQLGTGLSIVAVLLSLMSFSDGITRVLALAAVYGSWFILAFLASSVLTLLLLPWLPGRAFSLKGVWIGIGLSVLFFGFLEVYPVFKVGIWGEAAWLILFPALSSYIAMNFTGSTPFTSLSGVKYEMMRAVPLQVLGVVSALGLWITGVILK
ncbi:MAG TPA: mercury methylation corrinoid protein HgcA [Thermoanaerobaculia bacterium]|nr:mercury methylation corrinoid protein HgcA [Thermoanaerobaculia bacterium]HUM30926.1 mercury methylation corrinoid protein HgcA [Thermoanaerobaculia bacterium]HXK69259.1 mercury methylation corrinoid protein HgcA [Thermoanaerobaculia bacterium]